MWKPYSVISPMTGFEIEVGIEYKFYDGYYRVYASITDNFLLTITVTKFDGDNLILKVIHDTDLTHVNATISYVNKTYKLNIPIVKKITIKQDCQHTVRWNYEKNGVKV